MLKGLRLAMWLQSAHQKLPSNIVIWGTSNHYHHHQHHHPFHHPFLINTSIHPHIKHTWVMGILILNSTCIISLQQCSETNWRELDIKSIHFFPPTCAWVFLFRTEIFIATTAFTLSSYKHKRWMMISMMMIVMLSIMAIIKMLMYGDNSDNV